MKELVLHLSLLAKHQHFSAKHQAVADYLVQAGASTTATERTPGTGR